MICMEEAGMKKVLFRIIIPILILAAWMIMCYPVCARADGFDYFLYWIMVGCPYGMRKMSMFLVPKNFGIAGSIGILALDCIIGGLIGGMIVIIRIINTVMEIIKLISGTFGHNVQKWKGKGNEQKRCEEIIAYCYCCGNCGKNSKRHYESEKAERKYSC